MNLKDAYLRAAAENREQFEACLESGRVDLVYIDSCWFKPEEYREMIGRAHDRGVLCGLRLPYIWRTEAEDFFEKIQETVRDAVFDVFLFRNTESIYFFEEKGLLQGVPYVTDHSIYLFNSESEKLLAEMLPGNTDNCGSGKICRAGITLPLELNLRELKELVKLRHPGQKLKDAETVRSDSMRPGAVSSDIVRSETWKKTDYSDSEITRPRELVVYGRAPMMVSAQCVKKTTGVCDHGNDTVFLRDRKGAELPVKCCCRFCFNTIYNAVPTVLFDMDKELGEISPDSIRYEFMVEDHDEVLRILDGNYDRKAFTRGHLKRGV